MKLRIIFIIYAVSLPFLRPLADIIQTLIPVHLLTIILFLSGAVTLFTSLLYKQEKKPAAYLSLTALIILTYLFMHFTHTNLPIEKIHIIEYIGLSFLSFQALSSSENRQKACFYSLILCILIGIGDELIQGLLPDRFFDYNDILLNIKTVVIGHLYVWVLFK